MRQPAWVDVDGDGDLDLFGGFRDRADMLFSNTAGTFVDIAAEVSLADTRKTVGAVWFDYDEDGDLDLYAAHMDGDANGLYRNDGGRFTDVAEAAGVAWGGLDGRRRATRAGAEVRVYAAGTRRLIAARLVDSGSGYDAQNDMPVRVGLGQAGRVDIEVTYPAAGRRTVARLRSVGGRTRQTIVLK